MGLSEGAAGRLKAIRIERAGELYRLHLEDEAGKTFEVMLTPDQLDMLADDVEDALLDNGRGEEP